MGVAVGSGIYKSIDEAAKKMVHLRQEIVPQADQVRIYNQKYQMYLKLLGSLDGVWHDLKTMQKGIGD